MSKLSIDEQYNFAEKLKQLVIFVGLLSDDEVGALKELRDNLLKQNNNLRTVGGILVDLDAADHKIARHEAMVQRIDGLLAIHESNKLLADADSEYADKKASNEKLNAMFGLEL